MERSDAQKCGGGKIVDGIITDGKKPFDKQSAANWMEKQDRM